MYHIVANFRACKTRLFPSYHDAHEPDRQLFFSGFQKKIILYAADVKMSEREVIKRL